MYIYCLPSFPSLTSRCLRAVVRGSSSWSAASSLLWCAYIYIYIYIYICIYIVYPPSPPDQSAFEGGGTWFQQLECCLKPAVGEMLSHHGKLPHAGSPITAGTRYVLVGFFSIETEGLRG